MAFTRSNFHGQYHACSTPMLVTKLFVTAKRTSSFASAVQKQGCHDEKVSFVREKLRGLTSLSSKNSFRDQMIIIDHIQRLGVDHLFRDEIRDALDKNYLKFRFENKYGSFGDHDQLSEVALRFRLLRQQGYYVPADIFGKFTDGRGKFKEELKYNKEALMNMFEASHMSIEGEDTLDEAIDFTKKHLLHLHEPHCEKVRSMLNKPFHKSLAKLTAVRFHQNLGCTSETWLNELVALAKMDMNTATMTYKDEFRVFSKWWEDVGLAKDLKLARDQPLKWYTWSVATQPDWDFSEGRVEIAKLISLIYIVDDLFDVYGKIDDLCLFADAINKWEPNMIGELPAYMQLAWRTIFDTTNKISQKVWMKRGWNPKGSLQKAWADFWNASLIEARWNASSHLPTTQEYLKVATLTSGVPLLLCHKFFLMAESLDHKIVGIFNDDPRIVSSTATVLRLWDDLGCAKDEGQDGYGGSYLKCYMNQNDGASVNDARGHVDCMISNAWKHLNEDCMHLHPHPFSGSHSFGWACLNLTRMVPLMYGYEHGRLPRLNEFLELLFHGNSTQIRGLGWIRPLWVCLILPI